jgi:hypothetical protein
MDWFGSNRSVVTWLAFFALACQVLLSFGYVHMGKLGCGAVAWAAAEDSDGSAEAAHAYLSSPETPTAKGINARDRIGNGRWQNAKGIVIAQNVDDLHSANNKLGRDAALTERGTVVAGVGYTPSSTMRSPARFARGGRSRAT